jgi:lysophospholipase L1-like esterase
VAKLEETPPRLRRHRRLFFVLVPTIGFLVGALLIELAGRTFLLVRPSYHVLFLEPDREIGWKHLPNLDWTWAGIHWYAIDFSVPIHSNSHGFRDLERAMAKPPGVVRIVLLGDSMVEAAQVPLEKTAGQLLEKKLNGESGQSANTRYEVLNFGISNFGVGQYLLTYETYASRFEPDYVFAFAAPFLFLRTVQKYEEGAFLATRGKRLWIRPTFRLSGDALVREPAEDFEAFVELQNSVIESMFDGRRMRRRETSVIGHLRKRYARRTVPKPGTPRMRPVESDALAVNLKVLEELGRQVLRNGGHFAVVDGAVPYMNPLRKNSMRVARALERLCAREGFGYVPFGDKTAQALRNGQRLRWKHDSHFNEAGNALFAEALSEWMIEHLPSPPTPSPGGASASGG